MINNTPAIISDGMRDGSHNIIIGDEHDYREHSELETTRIVATPAALSISSVGNIDLVAGIDINLLAAENANLIAAKAASFDIGTDVSLNAGKALNFDIGSDVNINTAKAANFNIGENVTLNAGKAANLLIGDDLIIDASSAIFSGYKFAFDVREFLVTAQNKIALRSGGVIIFKGSKIEEN